MLNRIILVCLFSLSAHSAFAAEEAKKAAPPPAVAPTAVPAPTAAPAPVAKPNEAVGKIAAPDTKSADAPKPKPKFSNPDRDLTHCLNRDGNTEIIKCTE
jgi:outer membrane biosynthesis protein TonB